MGKSEVQRMIEQGKCAFCGKPLTKPEEQNQNLCDRYYNLRRIIKRYE
jgi:hypothetical protein